MPENTSQLLVSILLGCLPGLMPNNALRYSTLATIVCLAAMSAIYLKHPATQLRQLQETITTTKEITRSARLKCPRDHLSLTVEWARLLAVERRTSIIQRRVWETEKLTWNKYRLICTDIADCSGQIKSIRAAVQNTVEAEHQRKLAEDINETESILASLRSTGKYRRLFVNIAHPAHRARITYSGISLTAPDIIPNTRKYLPIYELNSA
ncbi:hypothetical protein C8R44DRAFT_870881 [Mycena epipterygia]|nr:hypothetical protein C8R44DRAFT_870881 [Mycena epipterygia]